MADYIIRLTHENYMTFRHIVTSVGAIYPNVEYHIDTIDSDRKLYVMDNGYSLLINDYKVEKVKFMGKTIVIPTHLKTFYIVGEDKNGLD